MQFDETPYIQGRRSAYRLILQDCLRELGYDSDEGQRTAWILEREAVIYQLRELCRDFGDNDWPNDLYLADVIEKHLGRHLYERWDGEVQGA